jgi:hypothetical protein
VAGSCEHGNEPSGSTKGERYLYQLSEYQLLKKQCAPWSLLINGSVVKALAALAQNVGGMKLYVRHAYLGPRTGTDRLTSRA